MTSLLQRFFAWFRQKVTPVAATSSDPAPGNPLTLPPDYKLWHRRGRYFIIRESLWWYVCLHTVRGLGEFTPLPPDATIIAIDRFTLYGAAIREVDRLYEMDLTLAKERSPQPQSQPQPKSSPPDECPGHERGGTKPCCDRVGEYNGFGSDGPVLFTCPKGCSCHD